MTANAAEDYRSEAHTEADLNSGLSPAKALFCGEIVSSCFWPFPQFPDEEKEMLGMVLDSVDRFLEYQRVVTQHVRYSANNTILSQ